MAKKTVQGVRVLAPSEYPATITATRGAYTPKVLWAAEHPLGLYYIENQGAGIKALMAYFLPKRKGSRVKTIGMANSMAGAFKRISDHEDELVSPNVPREEGRNGPVNIFDLGKRTGAAKTPSELDREMEAYMAIHKDD